MTLALFIVTGAVIGTALFAGIFYMGYRTGYKAGRRVYEEL